MAKSSGSNEISIDDRLESVNIYLRQISNSLGFLMINISEYKDKTGAEKIEFLDAIGYERDSIAAIVGTTVATVTARLSEAKKK